MNQIELSSKPMPAVSLGACSEPSAAGATILVVEDEAFVREVTCEVLAGEGYRVLKTRNAVEARTAFRRVKGSVQLLLTDVVLPGENGRELAQDLKSVSPATRVIFMSG